MYLFTQSVTKESINSTHISRLIAAVIGFERLEPYDGKLSRTVLRGGAGSNVLPLPDYASVEMMLDPKLRGKAVAVCGSTEDRHGIVLAKSELAKRAGVMTGMVNWEARQKCPELIVVPPQYEQYLKYSKLAHEIYYRYTDLVEPYGMDECWLDVSGSGIFGNAMDIAEEIRFRTKDELGLTVSIGVSFNKIFAKLGSDMKKPDAITQITVDNFREKVWPLAASELLDIGPATAKKLACYDIHTIGGVAAAGPENLKQWFGVNGIRLWSYASGNDMSRVMPKDFVSPIKSVGHGITCTADLENEQEVYKVMLELSQDVGHRLRVHGLAATGVEVWVRTNDLSGIQFQCRLPNQTQIPFEIANAAFRLFCERYQWTIKVRAVTVRAIGLIPANHPEQLSLFADNAKHEKLEHIQNAVEDIRRRFGNKAIYNAILMGDKKMPEDKRELIRMPGLMYQ